jgi:hypothetical protein
MTGDSAKHLRRTVWEALDEEQLVPPSPIRYVRKP